MTLTKSDKRNPQFNCSMYLLAIINAVRGVKKLACYTISQDALQGKIKADIYQPS